MKLRILLFAIFFALAAACTDDPDNGNADNGDQDNQQQQEENDAGDDDDTGDDDTGDDDTGDEDAGDEDAGDEDAGDEDAGDEDAGDEDAGDEDAGDEDTGVDENATCAEVGQGECFSNYDCEPDQRCADLSGGEATDICCIPEAPGEGAAGESCESVDDAEAFCDSAICISSSDFAARCSKTCETEADCPDSMQLCQPIAFSGSEDNWCFPTE